MDLFRSKPVVQSLAVWLRSANLDECVGQEHLLARGRPLHETLKRGALYSMIFWGLPGVGKTTLAQLLAQVSDAHFETIFAVLSGVKEIRQAVGVAKQHTAQYGRRTILFVDEVHRFNKSQQDAFLPYVEDGTLVFIGATTENPSFELNNALLSRVRAYIFKGLNEAALRKLVGHALNEDKGLGKRKLRLSEESFQVPLVVADGDGRRLLSLLESTAGLAKDSSEISPELLQDLLGSTRRHFDKDGEAFYDQISVLHKSVHGFSPDTTLYWFARMLDGDCDPLYIARRVVCMASEEVGNAGPRTLDLCLSAQDVRERPGSPEGGLMAAQTIVYLVRAPKSNAVYNALNAAVRDVAGSGSREMSLHLHNAPTKLIKSLGYDEEYRYAHDEPDAYTAREDYFPESLEPRHYYQPVPGDLELKIHSKLEHLAELDHTGSRRRRKS